ncbi:MAG: retron St85 family effector protein [Candidatus Binatia bacterium]
MDWLHHPAYSHARDGLIERFRKREYTFRKLKTVIFLCGGSCSPRRDQLAGYLRRHHSDELLFYADDVWTHITAQEEQNALAMEQELAQLADIVMVVVESPGTFTELGAFSLIEPLRKKLLPILDAQFQGAGSFINTGPVRWVDADSNFSPSIYVNFSVILDAIEQIAERLKRVRRSEEEHIKDIASSPKHLLFLLCDLAAIIGPAPAKHFEYYLSQILTAQPVWSVHRLLGLAVALKIISFRNGNNGMRMYYRPLSRGEMPAFHYRRMFNLSTERAKILSVLQRIDGSIATMSRLEV